MEDFYLFVQPLSSRHNFGCKKGGTMAMLLQNVRLKLNYNVILCSLLNIGKFWALRNQYR